MLDFCREYLLEWCRYLIEFPAGTYQAISVFSPKQVIRIYQLFTFPPDLSPVHLHIYYFYLSGFILNQQFILFHNICVYLKHLYLFEVLGFWGFFCSICIYLVYTGRINNKISFISLSSQVALWMETSSEPVLALTSAAIIALIARHGNLISILSRKDSMGLRAIVS